MSSYYCIIVRNNKNETLFVPFNKNFVNVFKWLSGLWNIYSLFPLCFLHAEGDCPVTDLKVLLK